MKVSGAEYSGDIPVLVTNTVLSLSIMELIPKSVMATVFPSLFSMMLEGFRSL